MKEFEIFRDSRPIPIGSVAERIVGRAAIRKFAIDYPAKKGADARVEEDGRGL